MPQINQQLIRNWQDWLNRTSPPSAWIPIDTFTSMNNLSFDTKGTPIFHNNAGYPLQGFVNTQTGEVRIFDARKFYL